MAQTLKIYVDGGCKVNPGIGAYASIILDGNNETIYTKAFKKTTNNRMELLGVIETLENILESSDIQIYSDSKYVVDSVNANWIQNWVKNDWRNSQGKLIKNIDLWKRFLDVITFHNVTFAWVKGHDKNFYNIKCDRLVQKCFNSPNKLEDIGYIAFE